MQQLKEANSKAGPPAATRSSPPAKLPRPPYKKLKKDGFAQLGDQAAQDLLANVRYQYDDWQHQGGFPGDGSYLR